MSSPVTTEIPPFPEKFRDLIDNPYVVILTTVSANGAPQTNPVWGDYDGTYIRINAADGRLKVKNMKERPNVSILLMDPNDMYRWVEVRGVVDRWTTDGAVDHINKLSNDYRNQPDYYARNPDLRDKETRILFYIRPIKYIEH